MSEVHFSHPWSAFLIFAWMLLAFFFLLIWKQKLGFFSKLADARLLPKIGQFPSKKWYWIKASLLLGAFAFFIQALAGPLGNPHYVSQEQEGRKGGQARRKEHELAFFLDISASMEVKDMRQSKTRLDYAKEIIEEIIKGLKGEPVSLYVFTSEVEKKVPSTVDTFYARLVLQNVKVHDIGAEGTDLTKAVSKIVSDAAGVKKGKRITFLLLTDGESTEGKIPENVDLKKEMGSADVLIIGMGSKEGGTVPDVQFNNNAVNSKRDDAALENLARGFSGKYYVAETSSPLLIAQKVLKEIAKEPLFVKTGSLQESVDIDAIHYDELFKYPLFVGIALYILALTLPFHTRKKEE